MIKKLLLILILLLPVNGFSYIGTGIMSEQSGVSHQLSLKMNHGYYHKIFSLGKGPFNPAPGLWISYAKKRYIGEFSFSFSQQSLDGYFGDTLNLSSFSADIYGGYLFNFKKSFYLIPKIGIGFSNYNLYYGSNYIGDTAFNVRTLLEVGYVYSNKKMDGKLFVSFSMGIQNPVNYDLKEAGIIEGEPYLFNLKFGVLSK